MSEDEFVRGKVLREQRMHSFLKLVNTANILFGFVSVLVEEGSDFCVSGRVWVPFEYQCLSFFDENIFVEAARFGKALGLRLRIVAKKENCVPKQTTPFWG